MFLRQEFQGVEMSLNAAFVDFEADKHIFLPLRDLSSEFFTTDNKGKKEM